MASAILMMVGGAAVNALAFSGSNYLFSSLGRNTDLARERERHDKAMEKLEKATAEWNKKRIQRLDFVNERMKRENEAVHEFSDVDDAMRQYYLVTGTELPNLPPKPELSDFYTPSEDQENRELTFVVGGMLLTGFVAWKLL